MRNIGKYRLLGILGYGGMARVFKVMHLEHKTLMAMKLLRPREMMVHLLGDAEIRRRFLDEARMMSELDHPNIAAIHEIGEHADHLFFVQEYFCFNLGMLIGESEFAEAPSRPLSPFKALNLASQTLDGLAALHDAGIVHRDIKPANLMLTRKADVKIIDFGLSRREGSVQAHPAAMVVGSPYYAAPEQEADLMSAGPRADLYAVGVVLYRMVTGLLPEISRPEASRYSLPGPEWPAFLKTALARDPDKRFSSALSMKNAIKDLRRHWEKRRDHVCRLPKSENAAARTAPVPASALRSEPVHTGGKPPPVCTGLNPLFQPLAYTENAFENIGDGTWDRATRLVWGKSVPDQPVDLEAAAAFVAGLNRQPTGRKAGAGWRLPTIDELISLLSPRHSLEALCTPPLAQLRHIAWLWSADMQTHKKNWILDLAQGAVMPQDRLCRVHVLPVRDAADKVDGLFGRP